MKRDSLSRLIARSLGLADVIQPVLPSRFEPTSRVPLSEAVDFGATASPQIPETTDMRPAINRVEHDPPTGYPKLDRQRTPGADRGHRAEAHDARPGPDYAPHVVALLPRSLPRVQPRYDVNEGPEVRGVGQRAQMTPAGAHVSLVDREQVAHPPDSAESPRGLSEGERTSPDSDLIPSVIRTRETERAGPSSESGVDRTGREPLRQKETGERKVTVHIGRIEVRAVLEPTREPERKHSKEDRHRLTLSDYLKQREKGAR